MGEASGEDTYYAMLGLLCMRKEKDKCDALNNPALKGQNTDYEINY